MSKSFPKPFLEIDTWPKRHLLFFKSVRKGYRLFPNRYSVPYQRLLDYCFGLGDGSEIKYLVTLFTFPKEVQASCDRLPSLRHMVVRDIMFRAVMLVQMIDKERELKHKRPRSLDDIYCIADEQMRAMFAIAREEEECPLPTLFGLSFVDTSLRVYCCDKESWEISPPSVTRPPTESDWDIDVLSKDGFKEMKTIVKYARAMEPQLIEQHGFGGGT